MVKIIHPQVWKKYMEYQEIERSIIGELMLADESDRLEALSLLNDPGLIEDKKHKILLNTISDLSVRRKSVDEISIYNLNQIFTLSELSKIHSEAISPAKLKEHIYILKERKYKKTIIENLNKSLNLISTAVHADDIEEVKNGLIVDLSSIELGSRSEFIDLDFYNSKLFEQMDSRKEIEGYSWGVPELDLWTSGIVSSRVYVIGGLKKSGKTRLVIHTLKQLHNQKIPSAFLSIEMPAYEVNKLLRSTFSGINDIRLRSSALLSNEERKRLSELKIDKSLFGIECKSGINLQQVLSRIRKYSKLGFKVIFIDYLQRIAHNRSQQAFELEDISIKIADAAREYNVAIVLLSQLNAEGEKDAPNMGNLKGSGGIGEAADTIILFDNLYRRTKNESSKNLIDLYFEQRIGDSGKMTILADLGTCTFKSYYSLSNQNLENQAYSNYYEPKESEEVI